MAKTLIIAEAGINHNGDMDTAYKMIDVAKEAGADIVKFQTGKPELLISKYAEKAEYQKNTTGSDESQLDMCKSFNLEYECFDKLKEYCEKVGIVFLSTPFENNSVDYLDNLGCELWKIPSGEITNYPYLVKIAKTHKTIILSTGMSTLDEIEQAICVLKENGAGEIKLLHCTTDYPAPYEDVNLLAMKTMREKFGVEVGYSDHTKGIEVAVAAVAMGATIIEKHFTLDKNMVGPDHKASLEPDELKKMVMSIRNIERAIGDGVKKVADSEDKNKNIARKSIVAKRDIAEGEIFTEENITTKRPGYGVSPMLWNSVLGTKAIKSFKEDQLIEIRNVDK